MTKKARTKAPSWFATRRTGAGLLCLTLAGMAASVQAQTLEEALATAYTTNPTILAARAQLKAVNEEVPQELSNWRPLVTVTGSAGYQRTDTEGTFSAGTQDLLPRQVTVGITQSLYRGGRTEAGTRRAEADVRAERAGLLDTEQTVLLGAATSYMDVWRDQSVLRLNINNEQVLRRQLEASQDRFQVGEITRTDVAQSESRLARATADRVAAEGALAASRARFQEAVGIYPAILSDPPGVEGLPVSQDGVVKTALDRNPEVVGATFSEESARHQVRVEIGQLLPELEVIADYTYSEEGSFEDSESETLRALAQVSLPLYQQGLVSSQVRQGKQIASQRRLEIEESRRSAEQGAIDAWENLQTARAQIVAFQSEVNSTRIALEGVRQENLVGARTILDVLDAEQEFLDAQVNLVGARRDELVAGFEVLSAMGRLTAQELDLAVEIYDPQTDYEAVRDKWFGLSAPGE